VWASKGGVDGKVMAMHRAVDEYLLFWATAGKQFLYDTY